MPGHATNTRHTYLLPEADPRSRSVSQLLPKTVAASERLARLRKQGAQLAALGMTDKVADNRKQQDSQAARIQVRARPCEALDEHLSVVAITLLNHCCMAQSMSRLQITDLNFKLSSVCGQQWCSKCVGGLDGPSPWVCESAGLPEGSGGGAARGAGGGAGTAPLRGPAQPVAVYGACCAFLQVPVAAPCSTEQIIIVPLQCCTADGQLVHLRVSSPTGHEPGGLPLLTEGWYHTSQVGNAVGAIQQLVVRLESLCDAIADAAAPPEAPRRRSPAEIEALLAEPVAAEVPSASPAADGASGAAGAASTATEPAGEVLADVNA